MAIAPDRAAATGRHPHRHGHARRHLGKPEEEGRLPDGLERVQWPPEGGLRPVV